MGVYLVPSVPTAGFPLPGAAPADDHGATDNRAAGQRLMEGAAEVYADVLPRSGSAPGLSAARFWEAVWDQ